MFLSNTFCKQKSFSICKRKWAGPGYQRRGRSRSCSPFGYDQTKRGESETRLNNPVRVNPAGCEVRSCGRQARAREAKRTSTLAKVGFKKSVNSRRTRLHGVHRDRGKLAGAFRYHLTIWREVYLCREVRSMDLFRCALEESRTVPSAQPVLLPLALSLFFCIGASPA
jgi:hypothetical protein